MIFLNSIPIFILGTIMLAIIGVLGYFVATRNQNKITKINDTYYSFKNPSIPIGIPLQNLKSKQGFRVRGVFPQKFVNLTLVMSDFVDENNITLSLTKGAIQSMIEISSKTKLQGVQQLLLDTDLITKKIDFEPATLFDIEIVINGELEYILMINKKLYFNIPQHLSYKNLYFLTLSIIEPANSVGGVVYDSNFVNLIENI